MALLPAYGFGCLGILMFQILGPADGGQPGHRGEALSDDAIPKLNSVAQPPT